MMFGDTEICCDVERHLHASTCVNFMKPRDEFDSVSSANASGRSQ